LSKFKEVRFLKSCKKISQLPNYTYPEFAFFGRSNVGKSSLLNMILEKKDLVKTGSRPGVTQMINLFIADEKISFADLPGYGYAKVPERIKKEFIPMIQDYISVRKNLKIAFLLIDIRRTPGDWEKDLIKLFISKEIPVAIILTKADKLTKNKQNKSLKNISKTLEFKEENFLITSVKTNEGKKEIQRIIEEFKTI